MIPTILDSMSKADIVKAFTDDNWTLSDGKYVSEWVTVEGTRPFLEKRLYKPLPCRMGHEDSLIFLRRMQSGIFAHITCCRVTRYCGDEDFTLISKKPILLEDAWRRIDATHQLPPMGIEKRKRG